MMFGILTLITALSISAVAIYYSVAGLAAIFAAAVLPIVIMGSVLEVAKLVTAVWLHKYWNRATWWLKTYLSTAVIVLMLITSMGIFGFLSKAHIEQTSMSQEQVALISTLDDKIARSEAKISRWSTDLGRLNKGEDVRVDNLVANEQEGLDKIYARIKQEKDGLRADAKIKVDQQQLRIEQAQDRRDSAIAAAEKKFAGSFAGSAEYEAAVQKAKSQELSVASRAQKEILAVNEQLDKDLKAVDGKYANDIAEVQKRIQDLRNQANNKTDDIEGKITQLEKSIEEEQTKIDEAREEKFVFEKEYRKLEAEVGPVKYIAEFIYGEEADNNLLEAAVRWVIITIIFVFDPLAVLLLLAAQYTFEYRKQNKDWGSFFSAPPAPDFPDRDQPKSSAKYTDLVGKTYQGKPDPEEHQYEDFRGKDTQTLHEGTETDSTPQDGQSKEEPTETDPVVATVEEPVEDDSKKKTIESSEELNPDLESWNKWVEAAEAEVAKEAAEAKDMPNTRNKIFWRDELEEDPETHTYVMKSKGEQLTKETKPESTKDDDSSEYIQNEEQTNDSLWKRLKDSGQ